MTTITREEFARICEGLCRDRTAIIKHNPIGTPEEVMLWMLLSCLVSYLNLEDIETPCFTGRPNADTYREALIFILRERRSESFDIGPFLDKLVENDS